MRYSKAQIYSRVHSIPKLSIEDQRPRLLPGGRLVLKQFNIFNPSLALYIE
jgi:hypothetical protein